MYNWYTVIIVRPGSNIGELASLYAVSRDFYIETTTHNLEFFCEIPRLD